MDGLHPPAMGCQRNRTSTITFRRSAIGSSSTWFRCGETMVSSRIPVILWISSHFNRQGRFSERPRQFLLPRQFRYEPVEKADGPSPAEHSPTGLSRCGIGTAHGKELGLDFVRRIIEQHGGTVWLESVPGQGSRFSFSLPVESLIEPRADETNDVNDLSSR